MRPSRRVRTSKTRFSWKDRQSWKVQASLNQSDEDEDGKTGAYEYMKAREESSNIQGDTHGQIGREVEQADRHTRADRRRMKVERKREKLGSNFIGPLSRFLLQNFFPWIHLNKK